MIEMIGRRAIVGLSLLCALMFSAMAVQSAIAATKSVRTTAFTCKKEATKKFRFSDEDCTKESATKEGQFEHVEIAKGTTTSLFVGQSGASPKLIGEAFGVKAEVECSFSNIEPTIHNVESGGAEKKHTVTGEVFAEFKTFCSVTNLPNCKVEEPIKITVSEYEGVEGEVAKGGAKEMGVAIRPIGTTTFATLKFSSKEGKFCPLPAEAKVTGTVVATGVGSGETPIYSGAKAVITRAMTEETLKFAGNPASFALESTVSQFVGNPIALTTVT
jgi:hypothetical protein